MSVHQRWPPHASPPSAAPPTIPPRSDPASFSSVDPRVHFDKTTSSWQFEDDNGNQFQWLPSNQAWAPIFDDNQWEEQQAAYSVGGVHQNVPLPTNSKKAERGQAHPSLHKRPLEPSNTAPSSQRNTAVYVSRLPLDTSVDELKQCFSRAGLILVDDENKPKIKLYMDPSTAMFNGSALVVFLKDESVDLAIRLFDDTPLRLGPTTAQDLMQVTRAEFSHKKSDTEAAQNALPQSSNKNNREYHQKAKRAKKVEKLKSKLEEWDSDDEKGAQQNSKFAKIVVLQHMFTLEELEVDPTLLLDLKEDVRAECELLGNVTNVTLYDLEPEGVMTVKFKEPVAAQACILKMNNRFFAGRQVKAFIFDGKRRYKKVGHGPSFNNHLAVTDQGDVDGHGVSNTEDEEEKRLEAFAKFLEEQ